MVASVLIGLLDTPEATRGVVDWLQPLGLDTIHFAFWLLAVGALWMAVSQGLRIRRLETTRPLITITPEDYNDRAVLEITNRGHGADFQATGRVYASIPDAELYTAYWEQGGSKRHIDGGGNASILVAEISKDTLASVGIYRGRIALFKMGEDLHQRFGILTLSQKDEANGVSYTTAEQCIVGITVTADPELRKAPGTQYYSLSIDPDRGSKIAINWLPDWEPSKHRKIGSEN